MVDDYIARVRRLEVEVGEKDSENRSLRRQLDALEVALERCKVAGDAKEERIARLGAEVEELTAKVKELPL